MLATMHTQGVALWGGQSFDRIHRFPHLDVKLIDFSPNERYLVTWSPRPMELSGPGGPPMPFTADDEGNHIAIWDVMTGKLLRTFPMVATPTGDDGPKKIYWPMFKWSPDEAYFARVTPGQQISVYEAPSMALLGKKSIKIEGVVDFEWRPLGESDMAGADKRAGAGAKGENILAYWSPEIGNQPARVSLMSIPSRTTLRSKNLFNVSDVRCSRRSQFSPHPS
jgi:translation initiation factor 3 subunit B